MLLARRLPNKDLVEQMRARGYRGSRQLVDYVVGGLRSPTGEMVEQIGRTLALGDDRVVRLHRAAALDRGYRVTLNGGLD